MFQLGSALHDFRPFRAVHTPCRMRLDPAQLAAAAHGLFRVFATLGVYRYYINHQHRFHTLVTHVRGPIEPAMLGGHEVTAAIPVGVGEGGNVTVYFEVLSYADVLTIAVVVDPDHGPDLDDLIRRLQNELSSIITSR
jgi:diacylglycerol O-acyltransferase / wax synthase